MKKRIFLAIALAIIMLMLPITNAIQTSNIKIKNTDGLQSPELYITEDDLTNLQNFIENVKNK